MNIISINGCRARIMEADRLSGNEVFGLPPGRPLSVYPVSSFKKKLDTWIDEEGSIVVPVKPNKGLWFDWTLNDSANTAILPSVKGCNPITGLPMNGFSLQSYAKKCPTHGTELKDNFCSACGFNWPPQNYICAPNTLWWDGFRDVDGSVRQFFFTADMMRDIASYKIGKENTVPAFGFAFYKSKQHHEHMITRSGFSVVDDLVYHHNKIFGESYHAYDYAFNDVKSTGQHINNGFLSLSTTTFAESSDLADAEISCCYANSANNGELANPSELKLRSSRCVMKSLKKEVASVAVGAGAKIRQDLKQDMYGLDSWEDAPSAIMRIYFMFEDDFNEIASYGFVGESGSMLKGMPVG